MLAPATLAALPSTRAIPNRDVFYVARPTRSILTSNFPCPRFLRIQETLSARIAATMLPLNERLELKEEVSRLSKAEQLQAMEWLWASLSKKPEEVESPEWHGEVLAARKTKVDSGEAQFLSIQQLKERLRR